MNKVRWSVTPAKAARDKRLSDAHFRVLAILGTYTDENGYCFPSLQTLANIRGVTKQAMSKAIIELERLGYVKRIPRWKDGARGPNLLLVRFDFEPDEHTAAIDDEGVSTPGVDGVSTPGVDGVSTPGVDVNDSINDSINDGTASLKKRRVPPGFPKPTGDTLADWLAAERAGEEKIRPYVAVVEELAAGLRVNLPKYGENRVLDRVARQIAGDIEQNPGRSVAAFCAWARSAGRDPGWYLRKPDLIWGDWPLAFSNSAASPTAKTNDSERAEFERALENALRKAKKDGQ